MPFAFVLGLGEPIPKIGYGIGSMQRERERYECINAALLVLTLVLRLSNTALLDTNCFSFILHIQRIAILFLWHISFGANVLTSDDHCTFSLLIPYSFDSSGRPLHSLSLSICLPDFRIH